MGATEGVEVKRRGDLARRRMKKRWAIRDRAFDLSRRPRVQVALVACIGAMVAFGLIAEFCDESHHEFGHLRQTRLARANAGQAG